MRRIRGCIIPRVRMGNLNLAWLGLGWQIEPEVLSLSSGMHWIQLRVRVVRVEVRVSVYWV